VLPSGFITYADISPAAISASQAIVHGATYEIFRDFVIPIFLGLTTASVGATAALIARRSYRVSAQTARLNARTLALNKSNSALTAAVQAAQHARETRADRERIALMVTEFTRAAIDEVLGHGHLLPIGHAVGLRSAMLALDDARFVAVALRDPHSQVMLQDVLNTWPMDLYLSAAETRRARAHFARVQSLAFAAVWVASPESYLEGREKIGVMEVAQSDVPMPPQAADTEA
jgi:hypothetical protein